MNFKIFEKTKSLFFIIYLHFDKISLKKLSHHLQICARFNYKVVQFQNYKVAKNNYKVAQKLQSCAKITKLRKNYKTAHNRCLLTESEKKSKSKLEIRLGVNYLQNLV